MSNTFSLNINRNVKRIKVNDAGEYITMDLDDQEFIHRLTSLIKEFEIAGDEYLKKSAELAELPEGNSSEYAAKVREEAAFNYAACKELKCKIDAAFGDEVCRKVFGDIVPGITLITQFFQQLSELLKRFNEEKSTKINKYVSSYTE